MTTNEPLQSRMIHRFFASSGLNYATDEDGDICLSFGAGEEHESDIPPLVIWVSNLQNISLRIRGLFKPADAPRVSLIERCNTWNAEHVWPRLAVVRQDDVDLVSADLAYPARTGTTAEAVADVCSLAISTMNIAWEWFRQHDTDEVFASIVAPIEGEFAQMLADDATGDPTDG